MMNLEVTDTTIPDGMIQVTRDEFYAALYADKRDIMPKCGDKHSTRWEVVSNRNLWGWDNVGYCNSGRNDKIYAIYPSSKR